MIKEEIITAIDIGTSKIFGICCLSRETGIEVLGANAMSFSQEEDIVKKGRIADIEEVSTCIYSVLKSLKNDSGEWPEFIDIGIGGGHLKGAIFSKTLTIDPAGREISQNDIDYLKKDILSDVTSSQSLNGREVLYIVPQDYIIDGVNTTKRLPRGMHGNSLEMKVHVLTADVNPIQDIRNCIKKAGSQLQYLYPHSWASAKAALTEEERKLGCLLVDIGKGTTDIAYYSDGSVLFTDSIKFGMENIDRDLSHVLHTPVSYAEEIKKKYAYADYVSMSREKSPELAETVEIFDLAGKLSNKVTVEEISKIVYARIAEILEDFVKRKVEKISVMHNCGAGVVLSGGGANLKSIERLASNIFDLPVRKGLPHGLLDIDKGFQGTEFASAIGTVLLSSKKEKKQVKSGFLEKVKTKAHIRNIGFRRFDKWLSS